MGFISENIDFVKKQLPSEVKLIAVSKTHSAGLIKEAYNGGQRDFGENKVQELLTKYEELKELDIRWHLIGHLQTNKVKFIIPFIDLIHSVDSLKLLEEINKQSENISRITDCLLQFHIATEETKFGLDLKEAEDILNTSEFRCLKNIRVCGVMGMASFTDDLDIIRAEFKELRRIYNKLKEDFFKNDSSFCEISSGMSSDWDTAVIEGSTMIRVGSIIFGQRNYFSQ
jgi:hypothetical protein